MSPELMNTLIAIVALGIAGYAIYKYSRAGVPITPELIQGELVTAQNPATELTEAALTGARAAEQLYTTGKITRDERLDKAFAYVEQFFPGLEQETILTAIESAVFVVNATAATINAAKQPSAPIVVNIPPVPVTVIDPSAAQQLEATPPPVTFKSELG